MGQGDICKENTHPDNTHLTTRTQTFMDIYGLVKWTHTVVIYTTCLGEDGVYMEVRAPNTCPFFVKASFSFS